MEARIVANLNYAIDEFFERAARSVVYRTGEWLREEDLDARSMETYREEQLTSALEERIRDVFYELFEIERSEDASCETNDVLKGGLFGIQRTLESVERCLHQRGGLVHHRELLGSHQGGDFNQATSVLNDATGKDTGRTHFEGDDCEGGHK
jgi:hypothetical protein